MIVLNTYTYLLDKQKKFFFEQLIQSSIKERIEKLKKIKHWIKQHEESIREALYLDLHKSGPEAEVSELIPIYSELNHALENIKDWSSKIWVNTPLPLITTKTFIQAKPKGVCLIISPWNFPFLLSIGPIISALAAGNTFVLKPSEHAIHTAQLLEKMITELFLEEEGAVINGGIEVVQELQKLPFNHVFFTGSPEIGKQVLKAAAEHLTSTTLELGGCNPCVIDDTADMKDAAEKIVWGKFLNAGQSCVAPNYVLVPQELLGQFTTEVKYALMEQFPFPLEDFEHHHDFGRIINSFHCERLVQLLDKLKLESTCILGGDHNIEKRYFSPTILEGMNFDCTLMQEEIFGPILSIYGYKNFEHIPALIQKQAIPLCGYLFSRSEKNIELFTSNIQAGAICINDTTLPFVHPEIPFGGVNNSGLGKAHGKAGFEAFSNYTPVVKQSVGFTTGKLVYGPYSAKRRKIIGLIRKFFYQ